MTQSRRRDRPRKTKPRAPSALTPSAIYAERRDGAQTPKPPTAARPRARSKSLSEIARDRYGIGMGVGPRGALIPTTPRGGAK